MCEISIVKYISFSLFISIGFSVIKFFDYEINPGMPHTTYPVSYDYLASKMHEGIHTSVYIVNIIMDLINHFVFLFINLAIDVGMIFKLRQTLKDQLEKSKEYNTKVQQEKKKIENENVLHNARSMIILNNSLNFLLKLPSSFSSIYHLIYIYFLKNVRYDTRFLQFFDNVCQDAHFCDMLFQLADSLFFIFISVQFFFYKHYDKKFAQSFNHIITDNSSDNTKKSVKTGQKNIINK